MHAYSYKLKRKMNITWHRLWLASNVEKIDMWLVVARTVETWSRKWEKVGNERKKRKKRNKGDDRFFFRLWLIISFLQGMESTHIYKGRETFYLY